jgi:putative endonuclease
LPFTDLLRFIGAVFDRSANVPAPSFSTTAARGAHGERVAALFLRQHGYRVLLRNFRAPHGEIDLICRHGQVLVFVEVRTRDRIDFGRPAESIGPAKQEALRHAADRYLQALKRHDVQYRFDAVEVLLVDGQVPACTLIENLFS